MNHYEDAGTATESVEFPYDALDGISEDDRAELRSMSPEDVERACRCIRVLMEWIWQVKPANKDGIQIRAVIACWMFIPWLRPTSLTKLAEKFNKDKQSLGRWVDDFKVQFPMIKTSNMKFK